jgi:glycosyltransferase 2 family protein
MDETTTRIPESETPKKKKSSKYWVSISIVLVMTAFSLVFSLYNAGEGDIAKGGMFIFNALKGCNPWWLVAIATLVIASYFLDGVVIQVFCRLYTRHYKWHQGVSNAMIGAFYNDVTPGASGGQVMQVYTMKKQGIEISNAASIMVMWFILYQVALIFFDVLAIIFEWDSIMAIKSFQIPNFSLFGWDGTISMLPLIIIGFGLNLSIIALLFLMSYSHKFHNFIMHYGIGLCAKLHIVKNPDKTRENLRVQVENFKIELTRLQANIPVTVLIFLLFFLIQIIRTSIPYFAGLALDAYGYGASYSFTLMMDSCFRSAFHQMVTGLFPLPGSAGVSELFFSAMYSNYYVETCAVVNGSLQIIRTSSANMATANILWRVATFHLVVIVSGFFAALYHSRPHEDYHYANRQTFVDLQLETFEERKLSSDTLYETKQLSRKEIQKRLQTFNPIARNPDPAGEGTVSSTKKTSLFSNKEGKNEPAPTNAPKKGEEAPMKKKKWDSIDIDD